MVGIIGAGKTGRGFIARIMAENNEPMVLIDQDEALIGKLKNGFSVSFFSEVRPKMEVGGFQAFHSGDAACKEVLSSCSLILVSVGGRNVEAVGQWLGSLVDQEGLSRPGHQNIILCENARDPSQKLRQGFLNALPESLRAKADSRFGFGDGAVFCTTIEAAPGSVDIASENYPRIPFDCRGIKGEMPSLMGLEPTDNFENVLMRKIYTYNSASGVIAYLGWWKGYTLYSDAANDPQILGLLDRHYTAVSGAICQEYGYTKEDQDNFAALSKAKFCDRAIVDTVIRNAREPQRKLSAGERIAGPAQLIEKYQGDSEVIALTAAAALLYDEPDDKEWLAMRADKDPMDVFCDLSGFAKEDRFTAQVAKKLCSLRLLGRGKL